MCHLIKEYWRHTRLTVRLHFITEVDLRYMHLYLCRLPDMSTFLEDSTEERASQSEIEDRLAAQQRSLVSPNSGKVLETLSMVTRCTHSSGM